MPPPNSHKFQVTASPQIISYFGRRNCLIYLGGRRKAHHRPKKPPSQSKTPPSESCYGLPVHGKMRFPSTSESRSYLFRPSWRRPRISPLRGERCSSPSRYWPMYGTKRQQATSSLEVTLECMKCLRVAGLTITSLCWIGLVKSGGARRADLTADNRRQETRNNMIGNWEIVQTIV